MPERPRIRVRCELEPPAWFASWPRGLRPARVRVSSDSILLRYRTPAGEQIDVALDDPGRGRLAVRVISRPGDARPMLQRLQLAVRRQLERAPDDVFWRVQALRASCRALEEDEGSTPARAASPRRAALRRCYAAARDAMLSREAALPGAARAAAESLLADEACPPALFSALTHLLVATDETDRALAAWETREDDATALTRALLLGLLGLHEPATSEARALASAAARSDDWLVCARLLFLLRRGREALVCLERVGEALRPADELFLDSLARETRAVELLKRRASAFMARDDGALKVGLALARALIETGGYAEGEALLTSLQSRARDADPRARAITLELAKLKLWRLQLDEAVALAESARAGGDDAAYAWMVLGAAAYLEGRHAAALELLEVAYRRDAAHIPTRLWRVLTLLELGRGKEALAAAREDGFADAAAWQLVRVLAECSVDSRRKYLRDRTRYIYKSLLRDVFSDQPARLRFDEPDHILALVRTALRRFGGNLSERRTFLSEPGAALEDASHVISSRVRVERLQGRLRAASPETVIASLERFARDYPEVPFGGTYGAEIRLWMGEYEATARAFDGIWRATRTRWGYIGAGASYMLMGRFDEALARWREGQQYYTYLEHEATHTYEGELWRKRGELERARACLHGVVQPGQPFRLGAWINYALVARARGELEEARRMIAGIEDYAPLLLWEAARSLGRAGSTSISLDDAPVVLEEALRLMRGNRSSGTLTFIDRAGRMRVQLQGHAREWRELARFSLGVVLDALARAYLETPAD